MNRNFVSFWLSFQFLASSSINSNIFETFLSKINLTKTNRYTHKKMRSKNDDNMKMLIGFQRTSARHSLAKQIHSDNELKTVKINYIMKLTFLTKPLSSIAMISERWIFSNFRWLFNNNATQLNQFCYVFLSSVPEKQIFYESFMLVVVIVHLKIWHKFCFKELSRKVKEKSVDNDHFDPSKTHTKNIISKEENILKWCINPCVRLFFFSFFPFVRFFFVLSMSEFLTIHFFYSLCLSF